MYTAVTLLLLTCTIFHGSQALSWVERVGPDGCTTIGVCPVSSPVVPVEPTTTTQSMVTSEGPPLTTSVALEEAEDFVQETTTTAMTTTAMTTTAMTHMPLTTLGGNNPTPTSVMMTVPASVQTMEFSVSLEPTASVSSTMSSAPIMSSSSAGCRTVCPTTTSVEPTSAPDHPTTGNPTGSPTNAPVTGSNVGLAVGLTLLVLVILTVVLVIAGIIIYKKYGKYRTNYEVLPTDK